VTGARRPLEVVVESARAASPATASVVGDPFRKRGAYALEQGPVTGGPAEWKPMILAVTPSVSGVHVLRGAASASKLRPDQRLEETGAAEPGRSVWVAASGVGLMELRRRLEPPRRRR